MVSVTGGRSKFGGGDTGLDFDRERERKGTPKLELVFGTLLKNNADGGDETTGDDCLGGCVKEHIGDVRTIPGAVFAGERATPLPARRADSLNLVPRWRCSAPAGS